MRLDIENENSRGGTMYLKYALTEQDVAMLSGKLNSVKEINMNTAIMRAFVELRKSNIPAKRFERTNERNKGTIRRA